jgi:4-amino-4-deoxy-L-arabinose transferase-like glycosyltransferase
MNRTRYRSWSQYVSDSRPVLGINPIYLVLFLIVLMAAILRFWRIDGMFHFMGDEGTQTQATWNLIHGHLPLLGPSLSIGSMHLGPLFYYMEAVPLAIAGGSPVGPTIMVALFGLAAVCVLFYYLQSRLGSYPAAGAAAAMGASFLMVEYSRRPWNPTPTPVFTLVLFWSLILWKRQSSAWLILTSISLGCLLQLQPVNVFLVPLVIVFIVWARPPLPSWMTLGIAALAFVLISSPLIVYDLTHHFSNTRAWLSVLVKGKSHAAPRQASSPKLLFNLFNRAYGLPWVPATAVLTAAVLIAAVGASFMKRAEEETNWEVRLPLLLLAIAAIGFEAYHKQVFEQYMVCLFVIPFIFLGALLSYLMRSRPGEVVSAVLVLALVGVGISNSWTYSFVTPKMTVPDAAVTRNDLQVDDTYAHVLKVDHTIVDWAAARPFDLKMASYFNAPAGYRYVLSRNGSPPRPSRLTYLLVEPGDWPYARWLNKSALPNPRRASRSAALGIVRLYEVVGRKR